MSAGEVPAAPANEEEEEEDTCRCAPRQALVIIRARQGCGIIINNNLRHRICRVEGSPDDPLFTPCLCSGRCVCLTPHHIRNFPNECLCTASLPW